MHAVLTLTATHDRLSRPSNTLKRTQYEMYHWSRTAALFNESLSMPIKLSDRDAFWATAVLLGAIAFSSNEANCPEESWPLSPSSPSDLEWLRFSDGKKAIWKIADPLRSDSVFHSLSDEYNKAYFFSRSAKPGVRGFFMPLVDLCNLSDTSNTDNNPYHTVVYVLSALLKVDCNHSNALIFLSFIGYMNPDYKALLEGKDPRALLLLAYWYAKVCRYQWWTTRRALLECQAICIYLERHCARDSKIQSLLQFPKICCRLLTQKDHDHTFTSDI